MHHQQSGIDSRVVGGLDGALVAVHVETIITLAVSETDPSTRKWGARHRFTIVCRSRRDRADDIQGVTNALTYMASHASRESSFPMLSLLANAGDVICGSSLGDTSARTR